MPDKMYDVVAVTLGADVAIGGTITVTYPGGKTGMDYRGGDDGMIIAGSSEALFERSGDYTIAHGTTTGTITIRRGRGFTNGQVVNVHLDRASINHGEEVVFANPDKISRVITARIVLGKPTATAANNIVLSQACTAASGLATGINGSLAASGVATLDVPRAIVAAWTGAAVLTVTGTDEYGVVIRESSASGTSLTGKKAFKTITGVSTSADITGLTVGTSKVLGLPVFLPNGVEVLKEIEDGAAATAGTVVAGVTTTASATTGDVRGTYAPNSNPDGSKAFELIVALRSPEYRGVTQF